jgi:hypothetical protein
MLKKKRELSALRKLQILQAAELAYDESAGCWNLLKLAHIRKDRKWELPGCCLRCDFGQLCLPQVT